MEEALLEIIAALREGVPADAVWLDKLVRRYNRAAHDGTRRVAKRRLLPYYLRVRAQEPKRWASWGVSAEEDAALVRLLQAKPRRTASGVATITVLTKPWPCSGACVFCPSDIRMPKSYLADEPACQRAERCWFDPYLQVAARLRVLTDMGHITDKVELIVLGGTWSDYPESYQRWFIGEMLAALNATDGEREAEAAARRAAYEEAGAPHDPELVAAATAQLQARINAGELTYNEAWGIAYALDTLTPCHPERRREAPESKDLSWDTLFALQRANETASHRMVGLVVETRPDLITPKSCRQMRALGCTKVQMGVQSLNDKVLAANGRAITSARIAEAMALLRTFGFKSHIHFMVNLMGATPERDIADYRRLVTDPAFLPDEVKLYPCALVESAQLTECYEAGTWQPYAEEELVGVLMADVLATPPWTRISRMIRDISSTDILAGNKKTNLRQLVEEAVAATGAAPNEIRSREISTEGTSVSELALETISYRTTNTEERFLQWVTSEGKIAGFCRLSLPKSETVLPNTPDGTFPHTFGDALSHTPGGTLPHSPSGTFSHTPDGTLPHSPGGTLSHTPDGTLPHAPDGALPHAPGGTLPHVILSEQSELKDPSHAVATASEAMIREVHVYGKVSALHQTGEGAQHLGLGRKLVEEACRQAREAGFEAMNVISAVGTRNYYRNLGFEDAGLYQRRPL